MLEGAATRLVDDVLMWQRCELGDDFVAFLAADEKAA